MDMNKIKSLDSRETQGRQHCISYLTRPFPYCQEAAFNLVTTKRIVVKRTIEEPRKIYIVIICNTISIDNLDFV